METTAKVKSIAEPKEWNWPNGIVYYLTMDMDNGDTVNIGKKSSTAFSIGDEIKYEVISEERGVKKIKEVKEEYKKNAGNYTPKNPRIEAITMCMSYAKDLVVSGKVEIKSIKDVAQSLLDWAIDNINTIDVPAKVEPVKEEQKKEEPEMPF